MTRSPDPPVTRSPDRPMSVDVFISYAREDSAWVQANLYDPLSRCRTAGGTAPRVFMDVGPEGIEPGQNWSAVLADALQQARTIVPVYSATYFRKPMCEWELTKAFELDPIGKLGKLTPVLKDPDAAALVPFRFSHIQFLDTAREGWFARLCARLGFTTASAEVVSGVRAPTASGILTQVVSVSLRPGAAGRDALVFAPVPLPGLDQGATETAVAVKPGALDARLARLRERLVELTDQARHGRPRTGGIEDAAMTLSRIVLPPTGLAGIVGPGMHPQLDLVDDVAGRVPWELLEEQYVSCPVCQTAAGPDEQFCRRCGRKTEAGGGRLALAYHLSHFVRAQNAPPNQGFRFLMVADPTGHLARADRQSLDRHVDTIRGRLGALGYTVETLIGRDATSGRFLERLADPSIAGLYVFGPAAIDPAEGQEVLGLADGPVRASDIEDSGPQVGFVFLNTCNTGQPDPGWDFTPPLRSVAQAFARVRPGQIVLAPGWPLAAAQAADAATDFFGRAIPGAAVAAAIDGMRRWSAACYSGGSPHLAWLAYRLIGNPNRPLPKPAEVRPAAVPASAAAPGRVFSADGEVDLEAFSCALPDMLFRAARRRFEQHRARVTVDDLMAGLVRRGALTRYTLGRLRVDPDPVYARIRAMTDPETEQYVDPPPPRDGRRPTERERIRALLSRLIVKRRDEMTADLAALLEAADVRAQRDRARSDSRVSEQDLLEEMLDHAGWARLRAAGLPEAGSVREVLRRRTAEGQVDANGLLVLDRLDAGARRIVSVAHALSQEHGVSPISNRLLLAGFLARRDAHAVRLLAARGVDAARLRTQLIASASGGSRKSFPLTREACEGSLGPVLDRAASLAGERPIDEPTLFHAFAEVAPAGLKQSLKRLGVDLESLRPDAQNSRLRTQN